jgi:hypothetical protein
LERRITDSQSQVTVKNCEGLTDKVQTRSG